MDPFTWVAIAIMVVSAAAGAYTSIQQGKAQKQSASMQAEYQRQQAEAQALQAKREAEWTEYRMAVNKEQAEVKKRTLEKQGLEQIAKARMKVGAASGTGTLLSEEIRGINELGYSLDLIDWETSVEESNIRKEQTGYSYQAALASNQADWATSMGEYTGNQAMTSAYSGAGTSLLAGGAQAAGAYNSSQYNKRMLTALEK